jgi:hypothetical protein
MESPLLLLQWQVLHCSETEILSSVELRATLGVARRICCERFHSYHGFQKEKVITQPSSLHLTFALPSIHDHRYLYNLKLKYAFLAKHLAGQNAVR